MKSKFIILFTSLFFSNAYALFCPNSYNLISLGESIAAIQAKCGNSTSQKSATKKSDKIPQEWTYYVKYSGDAQNNLKMTLAFMNGALKNISVNGLAVVETPACGQPIKIDMSPTAVETACGKPAFINTSSNSENAEIKIDELTYSGAETKTLVFENGKLVGVK